MSEGEIIAIEKLQVRVSELEEERDWLARQYEKATGNAYFPGRVLRFCNADEPLPKNQKNEPCGPA